MSELWTTIHLRGSKDQIITLEFIPHAAGVNIRCDQRPNQVVTFAHFHLADVLTAMTFDEAHIEGLPEFCCCPQCRSDRGDALAAKIEAIRRRHEEENEK